MAQEKSKRTESRFGPELVSAHLCSYTTHIFNNEKYFPEEVQKYLIPDLIKLTLEIATDVVDANAIDVKPKNNTQEQMIEGYRKRIELQKHAIKNCEVIKSRIQVLHVGYHLASHKANAWGKEVNKTLACIKAWYNSEVKTLKSLTK